MALRHYAEAAVTLDRGRVYDHHGFGKPHGFWVSVPGEDDWPSWCRGAQFGIDRLAVEHAVTLAASARILWVPTPDDLDDFAAEYGIRQAWEWAPRGGSEVRIDWARVADAFDGIIIAPHHWERRWDHLWYSGWDCASGCVWNLDAIESLDVLTSAEVAS